MNLLQISNTIDYLPVVLQLVFSVLFMGIFFVFLFKWRGKGQRKNKAEEQTTSEKFHGLSSPPAGSYFFLMAMVVILFFIMLIWLFPGAVNFRELGWKVFLPMLLFFVMLGLGFIYVLKKGGFNEENQ